MKNSPTIRLIALVFFIISSLPLVHGAANNIWQSSADSNFDNALNWSSGEIPLDNSNLIFGNSSVLRPTLSGSTHSYDSITFARNINPGEYTIVLAQGANLSITGQVIDENYKILNYPAVTDTLGRNRSITAYNSRQTIRVTDNSILNITGNANTGVLSLTNNGSNIIFSGNAVAGYGRPNVGDLDSEGVAVTAFYNNNVNATLITNDGNNSRASLIFTDNASASAAVINNYGSFGEVVFTGNSSAGEIGKNATYSAVITNNGVGSSLIFEGYSHTATATIYNRGGTTIFRGNATLGQIGQGNFTFYNVGAYAEVLFTGNAHSDVLLLTNNGSYAKAMFNGSFVGGGNFIRVLSSGIGSSTTMDGITINTNGTNVNANGAHLSSNGIESIFNINNATISAHTININATSSPANATFWGYNGVMSVINSNITLIGRSATAVANFISNGSNTVLLISNTTIGSNNTTRKNINFTASSHAGYTSVATGAIYAETGGAGLLIHDSTIDTNGTFTSSGLYSTFLIFGNTHITGAANFLVNNVATANVSTTVGQDFSTTHAAMGILGDTQITTTGNFTNQGTSSLLVFGDNANISGNTIYAIGPTTETWITGNANINNTKIALDDATLTIAMDTGRLELKADAIGSAAGGRILLTGDVDQEILVSSSANIANISFTDDGEIRGSITMNGSGTLNLNRENTLSGNITISSGTILVDNEKALSTAILIPGGGILSTGANITDTLALGGLGGNGTLDTDNIGSVTEYHIGGARYDGTFNGTLLGNGNISVVGDNALILANGTSIGGFGGSLAVDGGTLELNNVDLSGYTKAIDINSGGALRIGAGNSKVNILSFNEGSIIDLYVNKTNGAYEQNNLFVESFTDADLTIPSYRITLAEGSERPVMGDWIGNVISTNDTKLPDYDGQQVRATNTISFLLHTENASIGKNISFEVVGNPLSDFAANSNQASIADAIDSILAVDPRNPIAQAADYANDPTQVFDLINPAGLSAMARLVYQQTNAEIDVISNRLDYQRQLGSTLNQNSRINDAILRISSSVQNFQVPTSALLTSTKPIPQPGTQSLRAEPEAMQQSTPWSAYLAATGSLGSIDGDTNAHGYDTKQAGFHVGMDKAIGKNEGIAGIQLSYHHSQADLDKPSEGKVKLNSLRLAGYAGWSTRNGLSLQTHLSISHHDYDTERQTLDTNGIATSSADTSAYGAAVSAEIAKLYNFGKSSQWKHGPYARVTYDYLRIDSFTETGAISSLSYGSQTPDSLRSILGWKLFYERMTSSGNTLLFNAKLGWAHEYNNPNQTIHAHFASYDYARFTVRGANTRRDSALFSLGAQYIMKNGRFLTLQYSGEMNNDHDNHSLNLALGARF